MLSSHPHRRRSIRLAGYDYTANGAYFITIVTHLRAHTLAMACAESIALRDAGQIATDCWFDIPNHHPTVALDAFVVMRDHIHMERCNACASQQTIT